MDIIINGQKKTLNAAPNIASVLKDQGYANKIVAVAMNGEFTPRASYETTTLKDGDVLEIVAPMQGG